MSSGTGYRLIGSLRQSRSASRLGQEAGTTLVELAIEVSVLALLLAAAVALGSQAVETARGKSAAEQVAAALQLARQYAIGTAGTYTVVLTGTTVAVVCTADCPLDAPSELPAAIVHGATTSIPMPAIRFGSLGTAEAAGTVWVSYYGSAAWAVEVTTAGRIRACTPSCT